MLEIFQAMLANVTWRNFSKDMDAYVRSWSKMVMVLWSLMTVAMLTMPPMILMERICKEAGSGLNSPVTPGIAEIIIGIEMGVEDLEGVTAEETVDVLTVEEVAVLVETPLDPEPIIDWLWKTCRHALHGRT